MGRRLAFLLTMLAGADAFAATSAGWWYSWTRPKGWASLLTAAFPELQRHLDERQHQFDDQGISAVPREQRPPLPNGLSAPRFPRSR